MSEDRDETVSRVVAAVRGYLREQYPDRAGDIDELGVTVSLVEQELIDSLSFLGLVELLEAQFGVEVPPDDFAPDLFQTLAEIAAYVADAPGG